MNQVPLRYEAGEKAPHTLAAAMAAQVVVLILAGIMVTPLVIARTAGLDAAQTSWLVFAALVAAGFSTWLQLMRIGPVGSGFTLFIGSNVAFVSVAVTAIQGGGLPLLATLAALSALSTFAFTRWLPLLRRILTPAVGGTVLMLMALSIAPVIFTLLRRVPPEFETSTAVPAVVGVTMFVIIVVVLFTSGMLRLWAPILGVIAGSAAAAFFGFLDFSKVGAAPWIGLPQVGWPGLSLDFSPTFWGLLPAFLLVSLVACIETYADGISVQRISYRTPRPIDFRSVQGAINADGVGSFFAGLLGTVPNTVYSTSVAVVELTGVASRRVGAWGGLFLLLLAFSPKVAAVVASIPSPVAGAYIMILVVIIFGHGLRMVTEDGLGFEVGIAVCLGFWVGFAAQQGKLFNEMLPSWAQIVFSNGTTVGGVTAIILMLIISSRQRSRDKLSVPLNAASLAQVRELMQRFSQRLGWDTRAEDRLVLVAEEAMLHFLGERQGKEGQLHIRLRRVEDQAEIEMVTAPLGENMETAISNLKSAGAEDADDLSLRLLRGIARSIQHLQYHGTDYLLIRMDSAG